MRIKFIVSIVLAGTTALVTAQSRYHPMQSEVPLRLPQDGHLFSHQQPAPPTQDTASPLSSESTDAVPMPKAQDESTLLKQRGYRVPSPNELARLPVATMPSATPATVEQQNESRLQAWQAQEDIRLERQRLEQLALERQRQKPQVVVVQQDPWLSNMLAIPRMIGTFFGIK